MTSHTVQANTDEFAIGPGDTIVISVYNEPDLKVKTLVGPSGVVKFPLIGERSVIGKTSKALSQELELAYLDGYLVEPSVTVVTESYRPFFIRGAVSKSGAYKFEYDLTVDQAIAIAGGLKDRASKKDWYVIRGTEKQQVKVNKDSKVYPGDILVIEESLF
ncbi:polysaccharide biosynthesis/export family protein [Paraglaciecola aestuariivivens]